MIADSPIMGRIRSDRQLVRAASATLCLAFALSTHAASTARRIEIKDSAEVVAPRWTLADVATLHGFDALELAARSRQLSMRSPAPCQSVRIDKAAFERKLRQVLGPFTGNAARGSPELVIHRPCQHVAGETLQAVAASAISPWLAEHSARFELVPEPTAASVDVPLGKVALVARNVAERDIVSRRLQVWVDIDVDDVFVRSIPVAFEVHAFGWAWIATRDVRAGVAVETAHLERREIDVAGLRAATPAKDQRLKRPLLTGQALTTSDIEPVPTVERGSSVTVRSASGGVAVEARGEALQQGGIGQRILVRLATSTAPIAGRVIEAGVVEIQHD